MFTSIIILWIFGIILAGCPACQVTHEASGPADLDSVRQPLDRLSQYYARTAPPEPAARPVSLGILHNRALDRCFRLRQEAGAAFMNRDLFCRIVAEAAREVFAEDGLDTGNCCTPVDLRVLLCLFDDLRELGVFNIYSRNPDYNSLLAYLRDQGYLGLEEHSELAFLFDRLSLRGGRRAPLIVTADPGPRTAIGRLAAEVMLASHQYWLGRAAAGSGPGIKNGGPPRRTDDRFFDITMKTAGDVLGILIASVTGAGAVAGGLATVGASYLMEVMAGCFDQPPGLLEPCNDTNIQDADYWATWPGPYWY